MNKKQIVERIQAWREVMAPLDERIDAAIKFVGDDSEVVRIIYDLQDAYTNEVLTSVGGKPWVGADYSDALTYFRFSENYGYGMVSAVGGKKREPSTVEDIAEFTLEDHDEAAT